MATGQRPGGRSGEHAPEDRAGQQEGSSGREAGAAWRLRCRAGAECGRLPGSVPHEGDGPPHSGVLVCLVSKHSRFTHALFQGRVLTNRSAVWVRHHITRVAMATRTVTSKLWKAQLRSQALSSHGGAGTVRWKSLGTRLWKAKFFSVCDVIFLVMLQGKCEIDHPYLGPIIWRREEPPARFFLRSPNWTNRHTLLSVASRGNSRCAGKCRFFRELPHCARFSASAIWPSQPVLRLQRFSSYLFPTRLSPPRAVVAMVYYGVSLSAATIAGNLYLNVFLTGLIELPGNFCAIYSSKK